MESEVEPIESPEAFLARLGEGLTQREGVDAGLADILKTHILKAQPAQNAVAQAKDAVLKLAGERANPPNARLANA